MTAGQPKRPGRRARRNGIPPACGVRDLRAQLAAGPLRAGHRGPPDGVLHFVEVKTRREGSLTPPEAAATQRKLRALSRAASCYLHTVGWEGEVQFDLAAAEAAADGSVRVELIENALEYNW